MCEFDWGFFVLKILEEERCLHFVLGFQDNLSFHLDMFSTLVYFYIVYVFYRKSLLLRKKNLQTDQMLDWIVF